MESKQTILAMYSGGLDSLGMIYRLLTDTDYNQYNIHIHHVHNQNVENRQRAEAITVKVALEELKNLGFEFEYSDSGINSPVFDTPTGFRFLFDTDTMSLFGGFIASVNPQIKFIAYGMNAEDNNAALEERRIRSAKIREAFTKVPTIFPCIDMTKREIFDSLPDSLKNKFWSCRRPIYEEVSIKRCRKCHTCLSLKASGIYD